MVYEVRGAPWEAINATDSNATTVDGLANIVDVFTTPLRSMPYVVALLTVISITLMVFSLTHIRTSRRGRNVVSKTLETPGFKGHSKE